ncbi:MAG TPA: nitrous oxide reductase accessory protein NosL [Caldilineaceae bacterium]|mgnify:CR=1 FL=1|nr:nitrous oxide reductase accessory protein NosL [Caldilineaceae bacterium]
MKYWWLWLVLTGLIVGACARGDTAPKPPTIRYGEDLCTECNMIINDPRYAAGYAYELEPGSYESLAFDDIGDLLTHMAKHSERTVVAWYVHDYTSEEWLDATTAFYVVSEQIHTPMGHGIAAHATAAAAETMAQERQGKVLDWNTLVQKAEDGTLHQEVNK